MDLDFDDQPTNAAPAARAGAKFKPKGKPQPKKKQSSLSTSHTTLSTDVVAKEKPTSQTDDLASQTDDPASQDESSAYPSKALPSETIVSESVTINQSTFGTFSEENGDILSKRVNWSTEQSFLRACTNVDLEGKRCDDAMEAAPMFPDDPKEQHSAMFGDFVAPETDEDIHAQSERIQTEAEDCHMDMESLDIVHEEGITSAYEQHTGKFQPKPRLLDTVIEEHEPHYSVDDTSYCSMGTNESEFMVNEESRKDFDTNTTFYGEFQEEELNIPEVPGETVPEMEAQNACGGWEHEEQVISPSNNSTVVEEEHCLVATVEEEQPEKGSKLGKSKRATARKRKKTSEGEPNKSSENPQKKFKHSSRRQKKTLAKELLETPDDEIRFLPIRDMLRLVEYKEWLEKKEAKGTVVQPIQESSNMNTSDMQYYSQGFDAEDEFGLEENQEANVVKPDSPVNYQTYMNKTSRTRWSKEDTQLFYEGIQEFGSNLSMVQQLFPNRTRDQIKLKFKLEERRYPLKLNDALSNHPKHLTHFKNVIKKLQQEAAAAREAEEDEDEAEAEAETTTDVQEDEEPTETEQQEEVAGVKESDGGDVENVVKTDGGDECEDDDFWNTYKSDM